jgi:cobalamin synthase
LRSPAYPWALGTLTLIGAVSSRSFFDYLYQICLRPLTGLGEMPRHGAPRRFGCAIGAVLFILSGTGFYWQRPMLSLIPALIIVPLAFGAAFTQWCFASALYRLILGRRGDCC